MYQPFVLAKPVWAKNLEKEMNLTCGFRAVFFANKENHAVFSITASTVYRFFINGEFVGYGPARGPHGYFRVDQWNISGKLAPGENILAVEVAGYNVNCYASLDQPSFLQAELEIDGDLVCFTGNGGGFDTTLEKERVQKTQRFSFQRSFTECYRYGNQNQAWKNQTYTNRELCEATEQPEVVLLPRRLPLPCFESVPVSSCIGGGLLHLAPSTEKLWTDRSLNEISEKIKGFFESDLDSYLTKELAQIHTDFPEPYIDFHFPVNLLCDSFVTLDFGRNTTGFIRTDICCEKNTMVYLLFDEVLRNSDVNYLRMGCVNAVKYELEAGSYSLLTMEPYTLRYLKIIAVGGALSVDRTEIVQYKSNAKITASLPSENLVHQKIFDAAVETFLQNCPDIYMDCPSRERAGWLCDSFFTGRAEYLLTGKCQVERNFLENFLLPPKYPFLPDGMLPMCYPSDHNDGNFIPNWAMWLVLELKEYWERSGDREMVDAFRQKVYRLFHYFEPFLNEYGLLEKLDGWVFVDWSEANNLVQDVNFPSNMMYAAALKAAGEIYEDENLLQQSEKVQLAVRALSYNGCFFVDNALRLEGKLVPGNICTEACQNYAFFCKTAYPHSYPSLWNKLLYEFGPLRNALEVFPEIAPANAFIGTYVRLAVLSEYGRRDELRRELEALFYHEAVKTGTLWEQLTDISSCSHGFASYAANLLMQILK